MSNSQKIFLLTGNEIFFPFSKTTVVFLAKKLFKFIFILLYDTIVEDNNKTDINKRQMKI